MLSELRFYLDLPWRFNSQCHRFLVCVHSPLATQGIMKTHKLLWSLWLCGALACSTTPEPSGGDDVIILVIDDMSARDSGIDMPAKELDLGVVELREDMPVAVDQSPDRMPDLTQDVAQDVAPDMAPDVAQDMAQEEIVFEDLGERSVRDLFAWAQPGQSAPGATLHMYYSATLDVYVGLDEATGWGEREVRATFMALTHFRERLPEAYIPLFESSRDGHTTHLRRPQQAGWTNTNAVAAFVMLSDTFQGGSGAVMASNFYALGPQTQGVYQNIPFLNVRPEVIEGRFATAGPQLVYANMSASEARDSYLEEGLADSLLHERIHAFISQFYAHDARFEALRSQALGCEHDLEELMVKRTLRAIYAPHPDLLSETHRAYWSRDRELLQSRLEATSCYRAYAAQGWLEDPLFILAD
jgi:hypothetical protein